MTDDSDVTTDDELLQRYEAMADAIYGQASRERIRSVFQDFADRYYDGSVATLIGELKAVTEDEEASTDLKLAARSLEFYWLAATGSIAELGEFVAAVHSVLPSMIRDLVERN